MKLLPRLVALTSLLACSSSKPQGALVLAINTGELVLPIDTGMVGLYLTQIDDDGRKRSVFAREVPVEEDDSGNLTVQFPGTLVVESHGEKAKLLSRFVAFRGQTREVLTMREARASVPTERQALLRLNLFYANQGNVVDDRAGEPVLSAGEVELQQAADSIDPYARFRSLCDGGPAPEGFTSGDDGRCVALDVEPELRETANPNEGFDENASCYDVAETFRPGADGAVPILENLQLPPTGDCLIALPKRFDPARLNVATLGTSGFSPRPEGDDAAPEAYPGLRLRPLAHGLAFQFDATNNTVLVPERVCNLIRNQKLVVSQRTGAWRGAEPVCSAWTRAKARGKFDGAAPAPLPDASVPQGFTVEAPSEQASFRQFAVHDGELALTFAVPGEGGKVLRFAAGAFEAGGVVKDPDPAGLASFLSAPTFLTVPDGAGGTTAELYVLADDGSFTLHHALRRGVPTPVQKVTDGGPERLERAVVAMVGGVPSAFWLGGILSQPDGTLGAFVDPTHVAVTSRATGVTNGSLSLGNPQTAVRNDRWIVGQGTVGDPGSWWNIDVPQGEPSVVTFVPSTERYNVPFSTRVADRLMGFGFITSDASDKLRAFDYESGDTFPLQLVPASAVPTGEGFCFTPILDRTREADVQCMTLAQLQQNAPGHVVIVGGIGTPYVAIDRQHLYVAYTCGGPTGPVHVDRLPLADAHTKTLVSRCL